LAVSLILLRKGLQRKSFLPPEGGEKIGAKSPVCGSVICRANHRTANAPKFRNLRKFLENTEED
jgi:hypothetical protein